VNVGVSAVGATEVSSVTPTSGARNLGMLSGLVLVVSGVPMSG
jgi:hypothetical protein